MTVRFHLFPFRTQKLSSLVPKIVRWIRRVKIGSRRLDESPRRNFSGGFFYENDSSHPPRAIDEGVVESDSHGLFCTVVTKVGRFLWFFPKIRSEVFILSPKNYIIIGVTLSVSIDTAKRAAVLLIGGCLICSCTPITPSICWTM